MSANPLQQLAGHGQAVWLDYLSRELVQSGKLVQLMRDDAVVGMTSNPTIFDKAISAGSGYDEQIREIRAETHDPKEIFLQLAVRDIQNACDVLRPVYDRTRQASQLSAGVSGKPSGVAVGTGGKASGGHRSHCDGFVSMEVDPTFANDTEATSAEVRRLCSLINRPNLLVKIPATPAGLPAIENMTAEGRSINITLIFSLARYGAVAEAYLRGLERFVATGGDPAEVHSVASFFVSRVDTETDHRLDAIGGHDHLKGRLAVANAKLAYERYQTLFSGERWEFLQSKGATTQRCLWASTSTKNPAYSDIKYVEELIGPETVNTIPEKTLRAFQDHGKPESTLAASMSDAHRVMEQIVEAGIDYDDVTATLEKQGVESFSKSFASLFENVLSREAAA